MPKILTDSSLYIRHRAKGLKTAWCFACHAVMVEGNDHQGVWDQFRAMAKIVTRGRNQVWVCESCKREDDKGTLISSRVQAFESNAQAEKPRPDKYNELGQKRRL